MMNPIDITTAVSQTFDLELPVHPSMETVRLRLAAAIAHLILDDFAKLVQLLYTLDIPEKLVRQLPGGTEANTADLLAGLVIERMIQREKTRRQFRPDENTEIPGDEKW